MVTHHAQATQQPVDITDELEDEGDEDEPPVPPPALTTTSASTRSVRVIKLPSRYLSVRRVHFNQNTFYGLLSKEDPVPLRRHALGQGTLEILNVASRANGARDQRSSLAATVDLNSTIHKSCSS
ncbi:hypothetical protein FRC08_015831 [Ceratobasidium sp. 394]|nr:hypothetical protein FRC08_015831 [Ceratobasidium sp. 394]